MKSDPIIVGAGLAGLLCACVFDRAMIFEAGPPVQQHRALLRFRDESVSKLTGIPFRAVQVHKEIWHEGRTFRECSNKHANMYALKVTGTVTGRSIRNLDTVTRYVAPDNFYQQLVDRHAARIDWNNPVNAELFNVTREQGTNVISTMPLHITLDMVRQNGADVVSLEFSRSTIKVARVVLDPKIVDVYQTIYFPGNDTGVYRASITGNILIVESMETINFQSILSIVDYFGLHYRLMDECKVEYVDQKYGKIKDLPRDFREAILYELTRDHGIYSIGRFATWRNILLDDVVEDIAHVARLMQASDYGRSLIGQMA